MALSEFVFNVIPMGKQDSRARLIDNSYRIIRIIDLIYNGNCRNLEYEVLNLQFTKHLSIYKKWKITHLHKKH
jgi:hypothetical protein